MKMRICVLMMLALGAIFVTGCASTGGSKGPPSYAEGDEVQASEEDGLVFSGGDDLKLIESTSAKKNGVRHEHIVLEGGEGVVKIDIVGRKSWAKSFNYAQVVFTPRMPTGAEEKREAWLRERGGYETQRDVSIRIGDGYSGEVIAALSRIIQGYLISLVDIAPGNAYATSSSKSSSSSTSLWGDAPANPWFNPNIQYFVYFGKEEEVDKAA